MDDEKLKRIFQEASAPLPRPEAQLEAVRQARQAWEEARWQSPEPASAARPRRLPVFALASLAGLAAAVLIGVLILGPGADDQGGAMAAGEAATPLDQNAFNRERDLLQGMEGLFEGRLQFIVIKNGEIHIEVAADPVFRDQAVIVELRRGSDSWRIISYSGNTVRLEVEGELLEFDVLVGGDGEVIMTGRDFVWSNRLKPSSGKMMIEASTLWI